MFKQVKIPVLQWKVFPVTHSEAPILSCYVTKSRSQCVSWTSLVANSSFQLKIRKWLRGRQNWTWKFLVNCFVYFLCVQKLSSVSRDQRMKKPPSVPGKCCVCALLYNTQLQEQLFVEFFSILFELTQNDLERSKIRPRSREGRSFQRNLMSQQFFVITNIYVSFPALSDILFYPIVYPIRCSDTSSLI